MKKKGIIILLIAVIVGLISLYFDTQIVEKVSFLRGDILDEVFLGVTFVSSEVIILLILTSLFMWREHKRKWVLPLWVSSLLAVMVSFLLKVGVQRLRPFQQEIVETLPLLIKENFIIWNYSFPSFQAMLAFCSIPILSKEFPRFKYVWIVFACLIAFSRVYFGVHFLSDVIFGAIIGYLIGEFVMYGEKEKKLWTRIYERIFYGEK